jgi:hypothetical protein
MTHLIALSPWDSYRALGPIRDVYSYLLVAAARWQDGRERRTDPDHFALICVASDAGFVREVSPTRWTRTAMDKFWAVYHVLRCDVPNWCSVHSCLWPVDLAEARGNSMGWQWFDFLPYRETVQLLNRLGQQCEYHGGSPPDVLGAFVGNGPRHPDPAELETLRTELRDDLRDIEQGGISGFPYPPDDPSPDDPSPDDPPWR